MAGVANSIEERFNIACRFIQELPTNGPIEVSNIYKLQFYALFKQATQGPNKSNAPSYFNMVARAKWEAWNHVKNLTKQEAMQRYITELVSFIESQSNRSDTVNELLVKIKPSISTTNNSCNNIVDTTNIATTFNNNNNNNNNNTENIAIATTIGLETEKDTVPVANVEIIEGSEEFWDANIEDEQLLNSAENTKSDVHNTTVMSSSSNSSDNNNSDFSNISHPITNGNTGNVSQDQFTRLATAINRIHREITAISNHITQLQLALNSTTERTNTNNTIWGYFKYLFTLSNVLFIFLLLWPFVVNLLSWKIKY